MIIGAHSIIYSRRPEADRAFLRDTLGLTNVDVGDGWLIFGLPPAEVAVHPSDDNGVHEFYLMCDDVAEFVAAMKRRRVRCGPVKDHGWGLLTHVTLSGRRTPRRVRAAPRAAAGDERFESGKARSGAGGGRDREGATYPVAAVVLIEVETAGPLVSPGYLHVEDERSMRRAWRERRAALDREFDAHVEAAPPFDPRKGR